MLDFFYVCVYYVVPRGALLGREQVAATLQSTFIAFVYLSLLMWVTIYWLDIQVGKNVIGGTILFLYGGHFSFNRYYYLTDKKQAELECKYNNIKKWKLKLIGIIFMLSSFLVFVLSSIFITINK